MDLAAPARALGVAGELRHQGPAPGAANGDWPGVQMTARQPAGACGSSPARRKLVLPAPDGPMTASSGRSAIRRHSAATSASRPKKCSASSSVNAASPGYGRGSSGRLATSRGADSATACRAKPDIPCRARTGPPAASPGTGRRSPRAPAGPASRSLQSQAGPRAGSPTSCPRSCPCGTAIAPTASRTARTRTRRCPSGDPPAAHAPAPATCTPPSPSSAPVSVDGSGVSVVA